MTAAELAHALGLSAYTVLAHARSGRLPCVRIGSRVRFDTALVARLVEQGYNAHHVPSTSETEKAQERDNGRDVVGGVVRERRRRKARPPEREPRTMCEAVARLCEEATVRPNEAATAFNGLDVQTIRDTSLATTTNSPLEQAHDRGGPCDD